MTYPPFSLDVGSCALERATTRFNIRLLAGAAGGYYA